MIDLVSDLDLRPHGSRDLGRELNLIPHPELGVEDGDEVDVARSSRPESQTVCT